MRGGDLVGRVLGGEGRVEPGTLLGGEVLVAGEQQSPVGPRALPPDLGHGV